MFLGMQRVPVYIAGVVTGITLPRRHGAANDKKLPGDRAGQKEPCQWRARPCHDCTLIWDRMANGAGGSLGNVWGRGAFDMQGRLCKRMRTRRESATQKRAAAPCGALWISAGKSVLTFSKGGTLLTAHHQNVQNVVDIYKHA